MKKYKITIEELTEYPEMKTFYEKGDARYSSAYHSDLQGLKNGVDYFQKEYPTGLLLERTTEVYSQYFEANNIKEIIQTVIEM